AHGTTTYLTRAVPRGRTLCVKAPRTRAPCTRREVASHKGATYHVRGTACVLTRTWYSAAGSLCAWGWGAERPRPRAGEQCRRINADPANPMSLIMSRRVPFRPGSLCGSGGSLRSAPGVDLSHTVGVQSRP